MGDAAWLLRVDAPAGPDRAALIARRVGPLRLRPALEVHDAGDALWLRAPASDVDLDLALRAVPAARRFHLDPDGALVPDGARLPSGAPPPARASWARLERWLVPALPGAALPAGIPRARVALRLVRGAPPAVPPGASPDAAGDASRVTPGLAGASAANDPTWPEPELLACSALDLALWADLAPAMRLEPLEVAARSSDAGPVLVRGRPLPPIAGARWLLSEGVAVPLGLVVAPDLDGATLRALFGLEGSDVAVLRPGSGGEPTLELEHVPGDAFAPLTRGAVRGALALEGPP